MIVEYFGFDIIARRCGFVPIKRGFIVGFPLQTVLLLLTEHRVRPFKGPVLTLGRQTVNGTYEQLMDVFRQAGVEPSPLPDSILQSHHRFLDQLLFAHMGLDSMALDMSDFESPDIIHDLNEPIPKSFYGRFGTIIDGGTIEHIFDVRSAFANIVDLLSCDGRIIHITPCNNYVNHGFWQVSPTAFYDFYEANSFIELEAQMIVHPRDQYLTRNWVTFRYDRDKFGFMNSLFSSRDDQLVCMFSAWKTSASTSRTVPTQWYYANVEKAANLGVPFRGEQFTLEYTQEGLNIRKV